MKNERGAVTVFLLVTMLLFITILVVSYVSQFNKINSQRKEIVNIQQEYNESERMDEIYRNLKGGS